MRILLIDQYAGSQRLGMEYRPFCMGREWVKMGDQVLIVAGEHSHLRQTSPKPIEDGVYREEGVAFLFLRDFAYSQNDWRRAVNVMQFVLSLGHRGKQLAKAFAPEVVICASTHPFDVSVGRQIAKAAAAPLLFELHDIWPLSLIELHGYSPSHPLMQWIDRACCRAFRESDAVVSLLPALEDYLVKRGITPKRLVHIPNGAVLPSKEKTPKQSSALPRLREQKQRFGSLVLYAGGFAKANAVGQLVELAKALPQVGFAAVGKGVEQAEIRRQAPLNLLVLDAVPPSELPLILGQADLLWIATEALSLYRYGVAMNKLFDYMSAGRPVLFVTPCESNPISECGCGITVHPSDKLETRQAVLQLLSLSLAERGVMGERGRRAVAGRYRYPTLAKRYRGFLEELIDAKREG